MAQKSEERGFLPPLEDTMSTASPAALNSKSIEAGLIG